MALAIALAGCADNLTAPEHIARAKEFSQSKEYKSAEIELKNALKKAPNSPEARFMLGQLYATTGNAAGAEKELEKALELGVSKLSIITPYAKALLAQRKYRELLDEVVEFDALSDSEREQLHVYRGEAHLETGELDQAAKEYDLATAIVSGSVFATLGHVKIADRHNDSDKIEELLAGLIISAPNEPLVWRFQGDLFVKQQKQKLAVGSYSRVIELNETDFYALARRALLYVELSEPLKGDADIESLLKKAPKYYLSYFVAGVSQYNKKDFPAAQVALQESLTLSDGYAPTYYYLGLTQLRLSELNQAAQNLGVFLNRSPGSIAGHQALATTQFRLGELKRAKTTLEPVLRHMPESPFANQLMARIEIGLGNSSTGLEYLERLAKLAPNEIIAHTRLGLAQLMAGQGDLAIASLEKALLINPEVERSQELVAFSYIHQKRYEEALKIVEHIRKKYPEKPTSWNLGGVMYWDQQQFSKASLSFRAALDKQPGMPGPSYYLAQLLLLENKRAEASEVYYQVLKKHPGHYKTELKLAELEAAEGDLAGLESRLTPLINAHPEQLEPRLLLAGYYLRFEKTALALSLLRNANPAAHDSPALLALLTEAELSSGQSAAARETAQKLISKSPESPFAHFLFAKVYQANRDLKEFKAALSRTLALDPSHKLANVARGRLLTYEGDQEPALAQLTQLLEQYPKDHEVLSLAGWHALNSGEASQAEAYYRQSLDLYPSTSTVLELAKTQQAQGSVDRGLATLVKWNEKYPQDVLVRYGRSAFHQTLDQLDGAVEQLEIILKQEPTYPYAQNDLAWLIRNKDPERALVLITKAAKQLPAMASVMNTYAVVLASNGQFGQALRIAEQLLQRYPQNLNFRYYHALILHKKGNVKRSKELLGQLLTEGQSFREMANANKLLKAM